MKKSKFDKVDEGPLDLRSYVRHIAFESASIKQTVAVECSDMIVSVAELIAARLKLGCKLLIVGNGGSAADAQHMAAELVGRMLVDRRPLAAVALTTDSSNLTAIGNDYGYERVFERQVRALAKPGDVLLAISTSGNSKNVVLACEVAREMGCDVACMTGGEGGTLNDRYHFCINVEHGRNSCRIQEAHIFIVHAIVDLIDQIILRQQPSLR